SLARDLYTFPTRRSSDLESSTSKLGKLNNKSVKIYQKPGDSTTAKAAGTTNANQVFYIKKQGKTLRGGTYYQIRNSLSGNKGIKDRKSTRLNSSHVSISY